MIAGRLSLLRDESGLTQTGFAKRIGVSVRYYRRLEHGDELPSLEFSIRLWLAFGLSPIWLSLGPGSLSRRALGLEEAVQLSWVLFETWDNGIADLWAADWPKKDYAAGVFKALSRPGMESGRISQSEIYAALKTLQRSKIRSPRTDRQQRAPAFGTALGVLRTLGESWSDAFACERELL